MSIYLYVTFACSNFMIHFDHFSPSQVERSRDVLIQQTMRQLNTHFNRRSSSNLAGVPLAVHRVKVTFKDEPGEGSGVARSFYTAIAEALMSPDRLPNLDDCQGSNKGPQYSECHLDFSILFHSVQWESQTL